MAVPGDWTLYYDWGCEGTYGVLAMVFNANGTWSGGGYTGRWVAVAGELVFKFDSSETTYAGNIASKSVTGVQTTFGGLNGCFYLLQQGVPAEFAATRRAEGKADAAGRE